MIYFFKFRLKKEEDWKIGISGLQPFDQNNVSDDNSFVKMTDKTLREDGTTHEQLLLQLKKLIFSNRKSSKNFYESEGYSRFRHNEDY